MRILVVNAGSSSLKLAVHDGERLVTTTTIEDWDGADVAGISTVLDGLDAPVDAVGHRVVHGGTELTQPTRLDEHVIETLEALTPLAPLHQGRSLAGIAAAGRLLPALPHVACFDTAFHATMPPAATTYALPHEWRSTWPLRRFGFHGLSHAHASRRAAELAGLPLSGARIVTCHLGAGASLCAVVDGRSVDTTMGFTPLEGLVMQTRSGDVDPGLVLWLIEEAGLSPAEVRHGLEERSGLAGLSGSGTGDLRDVLRRRAAGEPDAALAFDVYVHHLRSGIAAMATSAGGIDLLVFTGGVGQHAAEVRDAALEGLHWLDPAIRWSPGDASGDDDRELTEPTQEVRVFVVDAGEDAEIARSVSALLS